MTISTWVAAIVFVATPELEAASLAIDVGETVTRIEATYRLAAADQPVRLRIRRLAGQELRLLDGGPELHELPGLAWFDAAPGAGEVSVTYELRGQRQRIPLFVPDPPSIPGTIEIRIRGLGDGFALRDGFPRLEPGPGGTLTARPANLPSFVRLPPPRGRLTVNRLAEAVVVLLVLGATGGWVVRYRRQPTRE